MVLIDGDITEYYAWFIKKRFNLTLNKPLRGAHISFINDRVNDMTLNGQRSLDDVDLLWDATKAKWHGQKIPLMLNLAPRFDKTHWWLDVSTESRIKLQDIRSELNLGNPYYGFHMSLGYANEKQLAHHEYITHCIRTGLITTFV